jgi:hypothetical protein
MIGWILFGINVLLDIIAVWYIRELLVRFRFTQQNMMNLYTTVDEYSEHVQKVYDLETYYGDSTLSGLLSHTGDLKNDLEVYKEMFFVEDAETTLQDTETDE